MTTASPHEHIAFVLTLPTLDCEACRQAVLEVLKGLDGIRLASIDTARRQASVTFDPSATDESTIIGRLADAGYLPLRE